MNKKYFIYRLLFLFTLLITLSGEIAGQNRYVIFRNDVDSLMARYLNQPQDHFKDYVQAVSRIEDTLAWHVPVLNTSIFKTPVLKSFKKNYLLLEDFYRFSADYALSRPDDSMAMVYVKKLLSYNPYFRPGPEDNPRIEDFLKMVYPMPNLSFGILLGGNYSNIYKSAHFSSIYLNGLNEEIQGNYSFLPGFQAGTELEYFPKRQFSLSFSPFFMLQRVSHTLDYQSLLNDGSENEFPFPDNDYNLSFYFSGVNLLFRYHLNRDFDRIKAIYDDQVRKLDQLFQDTARKDSRLGKLERKRTIRELTSLYTPYKKWIPYLLAGARYKYLWNTTYLTTDIQSVMQYYHADLTAGVGFRKYLVNGVLSFEFRGNLGLNNMSRTTGRFNNQYIVFTGLDAMDDINAYSLEINIIYSFNLSHKAYEIK